MGSYIVGGASGGVSTHSRPKAAETYIDETGGFMIVSTHSRPKAADQSFTRTGQTGNCFNTQPPEGG